MIELVVYVLFKEGYLTFDDLSELRSEVQSEIRQVLAIYLPAL